MNQTNNPLYFPNQKVTVRSKQFFIDCVKAAENLVNSGDDYEVHRKMQVWENLDNDIIDQEEIEKVFNPMKISNAAFPASIKNYPLSVPKIDLLQGEEIKRKFEWSVIATNEEAHSNFTQSLRDDILNTMIEEIQSQESDEEEFQKKVGEIQKYYKYNFKDLNEISGTRVLQYLWREQNIKEKFSIGFRDALVKGREIYRIDISGGEPTVELVDSKKVYFVRKPNDHRIEGSDIIIEINYEPIGKVIDEFHDYLKPSQVKNIEEGNNTVDIESRGGVLNHVNGYPLMLVGTEVGGNANDGFETRMLNYGLPYDSEGNVRVVRVRWLGRKKLGRLTFFNPDTGDEEERLVSQNYEPNPDLGETVKWFWVNEALEGTCIADKEYVKLQPREVQMRHVDNPSKCFLGYVGTDYGKSLMGRMEPYQYLYNVYMRRLEHAIARYSGPIQEIDFSKKPAEWTSQQWMYYMDVLGKYVVDSFNEGESGAARGKLAGGVNNTSGKIMNADPGNYIKELIGMLQYIETQMGEIAGVTKQRQGQIDNRETVGGVERAVAQSSHITEKWFFLHDETKKRVLAALLDTARQLWRNTKSKKLSFIMDDMSRQVLEINGEDFASSQFDLFISNSTEDAEIRQVLKQLSQAAVQNGASLTLPITILRSDSITEMARKIEEEEASRMQREQEMQQQQLESNERINQEMLADKQADRDLKYYEIDTRAATEIEKELIKLQGSSNEEPTEEDPGDSMLEHKKLAIQQRKQQLEERKAQIDAKLKAAQLNETIRHNKAAEGIARRRPKASK
jgi:hypothetical protein